MFRKGFTESVLRVAACVSPHLRSKMNEFGEPGSRPCPGVTSPWLARISSRSGADCQSALPSRITSRFSRHRPLMQMRARCRPPKAIVAKCTRHDFAPSSLRKTKYAVIWDRPVSEPWLHEPERVDGKSEVEAMPICGTEPFTPDGFRQKMPNNRWSELHVPPFKKRIPSPCRP